MLDQKFQIKEGQTIAVVHGPYTLALNASTAEINTADVVLLFVTNLTELNERVETAIAASGRGATIWLAYPKARQLGTDLTRDVLHDLMPTYGLETVRQIAIDETWSALRFKPVLISK